MSSSSNGEVSTQDEDQDQNPNKRTSEKIRREQENLYLEELSQLVSANLPEFSDSDDSANKDIRIEKGSILKETVNRLRSIKNERNRREENNKKNESKTSLLPKEVLGSLVLEALDGFMFIVNTVGKVEFISDNAQEYLGRPDTELLGESIYKFVHIGDHARLSVNLQSWQEESNLYNNKSLEEDTSKIFNIRFLIGKIKSEEPDSKENKLYEDLQVSAMHMLTENEEAENSSAVMCIARRIPPNEASIESPVESFSTQIELDKWTVTAVDTSGLPKQYVELTTSTGHTFGRIFYQVIGPFCIGKQLTDLVHPHDVSLLKMHIQVLQREGHHLSSVYRLVFPPPHYTVHVKTKSKIFKPDAASPLKEFGFVMSTHHIVRDSELKKEELPALRSDIKTEEGVPSPTSHILVDPATYGKVKLPIKEDVIFSSTKIMESIDKGIDIDSLIRGDPEAFMPMIMTAAKASGFSTEKLKAMIPIVSAATNRINTTGSFSSTSGKGELMSRPDDVDRKLTGYEKLTMCGLQVISASQVGNTNHIHSLTSIRSRHSSGRIDPTNNMLPSPISSPSPGTSRQPASPRGMGNQFNPTSPRGNMQLNPNSPRGAIQPSPRASPQLMPPSSPRASPHQNSPNSPRTLQPQQLLNSTSPHHQTAVSSSALLINSLKLPGPQPQTAVSPRTIMMPAASPRGEDGGGVTGSQPASPVTKADRLTGLLSNTLNFRSSSPGMVSKTVQPGGHMSYQQSPGGPLTPQNRSGVLPELSAASANQKPNQLLKELLTAKENLSSRPSPTDNISLRQLLNGKPEKNRSESELLRRLNEPAKDPRSRSKLSELTKLLEARASLPAAKRQATSPDQGPPAKQSAMAGVPSLESLLRKDVPSPVTTGISAKWSEIPNKNLPRSQVINRFSQPQQQQRSTTLQQQLSGGGDKKNDNSEMEVLGMLRSSAATPVSSASSSDRTANTATSSNTARENSLLDSSSTQEFPSELFDLDLSELDSMMSPELLSAMDNSIMSEDQAQISAIEEQLMQVEKNINSTHPPHQLISSPSPGGGGGVPPSPSGGGLPPCSPVPSFSSPSPSQQGMHLGSATQQQHTSSASGIRNQNLTHGMAMSPPAVVVSSLAPQYQHQMSNTINTKANFQSGSISSDTCNTTGQSIEDLMKRVPPNVTMKPGFDGPSSSRDTMPPMRHLSGDTLLAAPGRTGQVANRSVPGAVGVGGGPVGIRNTARHASGDSVYSNMSSEGGNLAGHNMRRYSGDSILFRRLDGGSVSPRLPAGANMVVSRPVGRQVSGGRSAAGMSPGQTSRPGSSFSGTSLLSPDINIPATIGSTNVGTVQIQRTFQDNSNAKPFEGPSGRSLSQEDLESFGLSIEVTKDDFFTSMANKQQASNQQQSSNLKLSRIGGSSMCMSTTAPGSPATAMSSLGLSSPTPGGSGVVPATRHQLLTSGNRVVGQQARLVTTSNSYQQPANTIQQRSGQIQQQLQNNQQQIRLTAPLNVNNLQQQQLVTNTQVSTTIGGQQQYVVNQGQQQQMRLIPNQGIVQQQRLINPQQCLTTSQNTQQISNNPQYQMSNNQMRLTSPPGSVSVTMSAAANSQTSMINSGGGVVSSISNNTQQHLVNNNPGYSTSSPSGNVQQKFIQPVNNQGQQFVSSGPSLNTPNVIRLQPGQQQTGALVYNNSSGQVSNTRIGMIQQQSNPSGQQSQTGVLQTLSGGFVSSGGTTVNLTPGQVLTSASLLPTQAGNTLQLGSTSIQLASRPTMLSPNQQQQNTSNIRQVVITQPDFVTMGSGGTILQQQMPSAAQPGLVTISSQPNLGSGVTINQSSITLHQSSGNSNNLNIQSQSQGGITINQQPFSSVSIHPGSNSGGGPQQSQQQQGYSVVALPQGGNSQDSRTVGRVVVMSGAQSPAASGGFPRFPTAMQIAKTSPNILQSLSSQNSNQQSSMSNQGPPQMIISSGYQNVGGVSTISQGNNNRQSSVLQQALSTPSSILQSVLSSSTSTYPPGTVTLHQNQPGIAGNQITIAQTGGNGNGKIINRVGMPQQSPRMVGQQMSMEQGNGSGSNVIGVVQISRNNTHQMVSSTMQPTNRNNSNVVMSNNMSSLQQTSSIPVSKNVMLFNQISIGSPSPNDNSSMQTSSNSRPSSISPLLSTNQGAARNVMMTNQGLGNIVSTTTGTSGRVSVLEAQLLSPPGSRIHDGEIWPSFKSSSQDGFSFDPTLDDLLKDV